MVKYENDCIGCAAPGYPCLAKAVVTEMLSTYTVMIAEMM